MDEDFIQRNLSPGGSADLLAMTYFLYLLKAEV
jgi:holo-ACP synthase/triphosphoribosyl-dephospho-CoA synthase